MMPIPGLVGWAKDPIVDSVLDHFGRPMAVYAMTPEGLTSRFWLPNEAFLVRGTDKRG